jgi:macrocin-O-methyltransferase TylF-like protien
VKRPLARSAKVTVETTLARLGERSSPRTMFMLDTAVNYLHVGYWLRQHDFTTRRRVDHPTRLFDLVASEVRGRRVLYLEFGVFRGASMRYWSRILSDPTAQLHGFDTFEGLPEAWHGEKGAGHFDTGGEVPAIEDPRVSFHKGLFQDTLPGFPWPEHDVLVVNMDADLYSSTRTVLGLIGDRLLPGSYLYFDEFMDRNHELRAFEEFLAETGARFELRGATRQYSGVLFQRIA